MPQTHEPWASYTARIEGITPCPSEPSNRVLVVNTTADEFDGSGDAGALVDANQAGEALSFREAMWIARNRAGGDTILFDPSVFPADRPATINLGSARFPADLSDVCIDGRGRGVVVAWDPSLSTDDKIPWPIQGGSRMLGLTVFYPPGPLRVKNGQVAACRLGTDGHADLSRGHWIAAETGSEIGPGNVLLGSMFVSSEQPFAIHVHHNHFGVDPVTGALLPVAIGVQTAGNGSTIDDNMFVVQRAAIFASLIGAADLRVRNNRLNVGTSGNETRLLLYAGEGSSIIISGNQIRGSGPALSLGLFAHAHITQNSVTGGNGIDASPFVITCCTIEGAQRGFVAPALGADGGVVFGGCPAKGSVEVFTDPQGEAKTYLGSTACAGDGGTWSLALDAGALESFVTTTFTDSTSVGLRTGALSAPVRVR